jgi:hypothetical protein
MTATRVDISPETKRAGRRLGYAVAIAVNLIMLIVVRNVLDWGWLPFLTNEFAEVVPWISLSLVASIMVNLIYQFDDRPTVRSTGQILVNLISIFVSYRLFHVFPFDFAGYEFNWAIVVRIVLILTMVGASVGVLAETVKLVSDGHLKEGNGKERR